MLANLVRQFTSINWGWRVAIGAFRPRLIVGLAVISVHVVVLTYVRAVDHAQANEAVVEMPQPWSCS